MNPTVTSLLAVLLVAFAVGGATAQNAPAISWPNVRPVHLASTFFEEFPVLQRLFARHRPITSYLEGTVSTRNQFPFQVALVLNRRGQLVYCGGSLISNQWILTAGHCLDGVTNGTAILGAHRVRNAAEPGQLRFTVNQFFPHPGWNGLRLADDVGLVRLPSAIQAGANVAPVRLSNYRQVPSTYVLQQATLSGFGRALFAPATHDVAVRWSFMRVIGLAACNVRQPDLTLETAQFCAEPVYGQQCPADAGGPLTVVEADGSPTQIGVTSFVTGLGCSTRPAIFTRLNFYLRWIQQTTGINVANDFTF